MRRLITIIFTVLLCFTFASCNDKKNEDVAMSGNSFCVTEDGVYHINGEHVSFLDAQTGYDVVLCNDPSCNHEPKSDKNPVPICDAVSMYGEEIYDIIKYNENLYWILGSADTSKIVIYKSELDGSAKSIVCEINGFFMKGIMPSICADGKLYFVAWSFAQQEQDVDFSSFCETIYEVDLSNGKYEELFETITKEYTITRFLYNNGSLYYTFADHEYGMRETINANGEKEEFYGVVKSKYEIHAIDIKTKKIKLVHSPQDEEYSFMVGFDEKGLIRGEIEDKVTKILNSKGNVIFSCEGPTFSYLDGNNLILFIGHEYIIIDTVKEKEKARFSHDLWINLLGDNEEYFVTSSIVNGQVKYDLIEKDSFYNGVFKSVDKITQMPVVETPQATPTEIPTWEMVSAEMNKKYADKTRIVWYMNGDMIDASAEFARTANEYIDKKGYDFFVDFYYTDSGFCEYDSAVSLKNKGKQADIISTGLCMDPVGDVYYAFVRDGLLASWSELLESDSGREFKAFYDEKFWKAMEINGEVYGFPVRPVFDVAPGYIFNKAVLEEYGLTVDDFTGDLKNDMPIFKRIYESEKEKGNEDFLTIRISANNTYIPYERVITNSAAQKAISMRFTEDVSQIVNFYEQEDVKDYLKTIGEYFSEEIGTYESIPYDMYDFLCLYTNMSGYEDVKALAQRCAPKEKGDAFGEQLQLPDDLELVAKRTESTGYVITGTERCYGIASWSEHKQEAFEVLKLLYTDSEFANIMRFGKKGETYEIVEGRAVYTEAAIEKAEIDSRHLYFSDIILNLPKEGERADKKEIYASRLEDAALTSLTGFHYDNLETLELQQTIGRIEQEYAGLWSGAYEDVDATLAELNAKLYEAGLQTLLDDINAQYEAWKSAK